MPQRFDDAFRAFHTLKGGAGIVDFAAMQEARPCRGERVHGGARRVAAALGARHRQLPHVSRPGRRLARYHRKHGRAAAGRRRGCNRRALRARGEPAPTSAAPAGAAGDGWLDALVRTHAAAAAAGTNGAALPPSGRQLLPATGPARAHCRAAGLARNRHRAARCMAAARRARSVFVQSRDHGVARSLARGRGGGARRRAASLRRRGSRRPHACRLAAESLPPRARELLEAQLQLLAAAGESHAVSHIASAGIVAANVLRHLGRTAEADAMAAEAAAAVAEGGPQRLVQAIKAVARGSAGGTRSRARRCRAATTVARGRCA